MEGKRKREREILRKRRKKKSDRADELTKGISRKKGV